MEGCVVCTNDAFCSIELSANHGAMAMAMTIPVSCPGESGQGAQGAHLHCGRALHKRRELLHGSRAVEGREAAVLHRPGSGN